MAVREATKTALQSSGIWLEGIEGIGLSGQMHGTVLLDGHLKVLGPAIIWADGRSQEQCREIYEKFGKEEILKITSNPMMPGFMAPLYCGSRKNEPSIFERIHKVLLPKDYIRFRLTGTLVTDFSDASATLLFDVKRRRWSPEIISFLGLGENLLPEVYESIEVVGEVSQEASEETLLPKGIRVVAGGGDSPVGAVGCGLVESGMGSVNIGSAGQVFAVLDSFKVDPKYRVHTFCHAVPNKWYVQGAILSAGLALDWFVRGLGFDEILEKTGVDAYDFLLKESESAPPGSNGLIFVPYLLGERSPHMDPQARGVLFGLTVSHKRAHLVRAIMEGVAYALRDSLEIFEEMGVKVERMVARGGGVRSEVWRKILADVLARQLVGVEVEEAAFGVALLAGVGSKIYKDLNEAVKKTIRIRSLTDPDPDNVRIYNQLYQGIFRRLYPELKDYFKLL